MGLRGKFIGIYTLIFLSVLMVVAVSFQNQLRMQRITDTLDQGTALLEQSRLVRRITNDVMIASFAPETYANLKDVLYFESAAMALRSWGEETREFKVLFRAFMDNPTVQDLVFRGVLKDEHETAEIMSRKAFERLDSLYDLLLDIRNRGLLGEDLYERIQRSSDPDLIALFDEARQTSYYLANSFESFLNYYIEALGAEAAVIRADLVRSFIILGLVTALAATLVTLIFSTKMVHRLETLGDALRRTAAGDFSTKLQFDTRDEFEDLARSFNDYAATLKINLDSMVSLARDVAERAFAAEHEAEAAEGLDAVSRVLRAVTEVAATGRPGLSSLLVPPRGSPETAALFNSGPRAAGSGNGCSDGSRDGGGYRFTPADLEDIARVGARSSSENGEGDPARKLIAADGAEILAGPLTAGGRAFGVLAVADGSPFNDLDMIRFGNYVEFAGVLADNAAAYAELAEERNAEYLALQSQIQPHFLYNVLGGFAALNRMGEKDTLERSIIALKELLRYAVDHDDQATVGEELNFIRRYCELQKMRFQDRLEWSVTVESGLESLKIPKLLLQPLVENAIIHGIEPTGEPGELEVRVSRIGEGDGAGDGAVALPAAAAYYGNAAHPGNDAHSGAAHPKSTGASFILITVRDNGAGFDSERTSRGVGLQNVERRLALAYPEPAGSGAVSEAVCSSARLIMKSAPGAGCVSTLLLPEVSP